MSSRGDRLKKMVLLISAFCFLAFMGLCLAQNNEDGSQNMTVLSQDSGINLSKINYSLYSSGQLWSLIDSFDIGEAVKFSAPKPDWKLKQIRVLGWNGYNETSKTVPPPFNFLIEVRDEDMNLLYRLIDTQNAYFTDKVPVIRGIDIPALPVTENFYIIFYDRSAMRIGMEVENGTGNSYFYNSKYGDLFPAEVSFEGSDLIKVNWIIRAVGE